MVTLNFLFVVPRYAPKGTFYNYPLGLVSVFSSLKSAGFNVSCLNLCHTELPLEAALSEAMREKGIDVVCTGGMSLSWGLLEEVLSAAKRVKPSVRTVVGGAIITADPELAMTHLPIDIGVKGEGELTMLSLAAALQSDGPLADVEGIIYRGSGSELLQTPDRKSIESLDDLPLGDYDAFGFPEWMPLIKYARQFTPFESMGEVRYAEIMGSRSCPFACTFCYHPLGKKYRQRSLDHVFREIDLLTEKYGVNVINFQDELFSADRKRILAFAERIAPYKVNWLAQMRVNDVSRDLLDALKRSGMIYAAFGVESMNDAVLKSMKKRTTRGEIENAFKVAREAGFLCSGNIILGDPADTRETMNDSIDWWLAHQEYIVSLGFILTLPDAPIYRLALERGLIRDKYRHVAARFPIINLTSLPDSEFYGLVFKVAFLNHYRKNLLEGELISSERLDESHKGRAFHDLKLKCPHCGDERVYRRFMSDSLPYLVAFCEGCFASFKVSQRKAFPREYRLIQTVGATIVQLAHAYLLRFRAVRDNRQSLIALLDRLRAA